jgi:ribosomal protein S18 acetylase RimI-like enzyme
VTNGVAVVAEDSTGWHGLALGAMEGGVVVNVYSMWVHPDRRREGIGQALLHGVLTWGRERGATTARLGVVDDNIAAMALYQREGFVPTGERERLRSDEAHEVIYLARELG